MTDSAVVGMKMRQFGATGLMLPCLSVGTAALGRPTYLNLGHAADLADSSVDAMRLLTHQVLDAAYTMGLRHFDTARSYGLAEDFLSEWLAQRAYGDVVVTSKWGYRYVGDWKIDRFPQETKDLSVDAFLDQSAETTRKLGGLLTGYQIHSATIDSGVLQDRNVLHAMSTLAESGVLIGVSTTGPGQAETIRTVAELRHSGLAPFSFVQSTWNILETSATAALRDATDAGLGVIVKEALANGRLVKDPHIRSLVVELARKYDVGPDAVCLAAAIALDFLPLVLSGPISVAQLTSNVNAISLDLTEEELAQLSGLTEDATDYWATRSGLPWT